jgi:hypothetical protein
VSDAIAIEIEDQTDPIKTINTLKSRYGISDEKARLDTLVKISQLRLGDYTGVTDFLNKHREMKYNLNRMGYTYDDVQMSSNILAHLPDSYNDFCKR